MTHSDADLEFFVTHVFSIAYDRVLIIIVKPTISEKPVQQAITLTPSFGNI